MQEHQSINLKGVTWNEWRWVRNKEKTSIDLTQQNSTKWIDYGWPVSHRFPTTWFFWVHFHWKQTSFFAILEWNPECTTGSNLINPSNTVSILGWCPDIVELSFEESVTAKPDLPVFRLSDGTVSQNLRKTFKRLMIDTGLLICPHIHSRSK